MKKIIPAILISLFCTVSAAAKEPMFSAFKESYCATGIPLNTKPDWNTNDLTFQVSMRFNAFQNIGNKNWDVFLAYSQLSIWEIYRPSNPFKSSIYSPGIYAYHPLTLDRDGVKSDLLFGYEHRSNGYDSKFSRSLDYAFLTFTQRFGRYFTAQLTGRFGIGSIGNDFSLEMFNKYQGYINAAVAFHTPDKRFIASASVTPLFQGDIPANISAEISFRPTRDHDWFSLIARYHYGYDENQLDCATDGVFLKHMLRFGIAIQPQRMSHKLFF